MINTNTELNLNPPFLKTAVSGSRFIPMLFSTDMVKAILKGTKTQTRRIINPQPENFKPNSIISNCNFKNGNFCFKHKISNNPDRFEITDLMKSKVNFGDIIWLRETFCNDERGSESGEDDCFYYKADLADDIWLGSWKPSLFMPKKACRIFLKVVSVSVEVLHDISEIDAINEGIEIVDNIPMLYNNYLNGKNIIWDEIGSIKKTYGFTNPINSYKSLWQKINGQNNWNENPFVFVYKFQRIDEPYGFR